MSLHWLDWFEGFIRRYLRLFSGRKGPNRQSPADRAVSSCSPQSQIWPYEVLKLPCVY